MPGAFIRTRPSKPRRLIETRRLLETRRLEHWPLVSGRLRAEFIDVIVQMFPVYVNSQPLNLLG